MKRYLSMLVLLAVVSTIAFAPATALAANDPAANQVIETIHLNQATAEQLQSLPGVGAPAGHRTVAREGCGEATAKQQLTVD